MAERYFSAMVLGGRLYIQGVSDNRPWNPRITFHPEQVAHELTGIYPKDRKIRSEEELREAARTSRSEFGAHTVWIPESLLALARRVWEETRMEVSDAD
jgi:hypothetical protein